MLKFDAAGLWSAEPRHWEVRIWVQVNRGTFVCHEISCTLKLPHFYSSKRGTDRLKPCHSCLCDDAAFAPLALGVQRKAAPSSAQYYKITFREGCYSLDDKVVEGLKLDPFCNAYLVCSVPAHICSDDPVKFGFRFLVISSSTHTCILDAAK